jgi:hypothetical protein
MGPDSQIKFGSESVMIPFGTAPTEEVTRNGKSKSYRTTNISNAENEII